MNEQLPPLPSIHPEVFKTESGLRYLKNCGLAMISRPYVDLRGVQPFLDGFDEECGFANYLKDPTPLTDAEQLVKFGGQLCYFSFGETRTWNDKADQYFHNIKSHGHGSVLEHANFSFIIYGVPRSFTHELVRHRAGAAFSQVSQRYCGRRELRFVERPEYQDDPVLHEWFLEWIEKSADEYERVAERLADRLDSQQAQERADGCTKPPARRSELRKLVNQAARSKLPNEVEAPIQFTGNVRTLRHILEMRASEHADLEIRALVFYIYTLVLEFAPNLFSDYEVAKYRGTSCLTTKFRKV